MATTVSLKPNAVEISGSTSGTTTLQATAVAGTTTLTLPAATDTLIGRATTDTLTNKTLTGAAMNGTVGATTPSTGAFTTLSASGTVTLSGASAEVIKSNNTGYTIINGGSSATGAAGSQVVVAGVSHATIPGQLLLDYGTGGSIKLRDNGGVTKAEVSSTGLAVTGLTDISAATSGQIKFPATQNASADANTLDDYEEGTFAPTLFFGATEISVYNAQVGRYTKIGNTVYFTAFIQVQQKGAGTGSVTVRSLPFTSQNTNSLKYSFSVTGQSLTSLTGALFGVMDENTTQIGLFQTDTTGGVALTDAAFTTFSNDNIIVTGTYQV